MKKKNKISPYLQHLAFVLFVFTVAQIISKDTELSMFFALISSNSIIYSFITSRKSD